MKKCIGLKFRDWAFILSAATLFSCGEKNYSANLYTVNKNTRVNGKYIVILNTNTESFLNTTEINTKIEHSYKNIFNGFSADLQPEQVEQLRKNNSVQGIYEVSSRHLNGVQSNPTWGLDRLDQTSGSLDKKYRYNATGKGVTAYVVDTGINTAHPDFEGRAILIADVTTDKGTTYENKDGIGHGTHVSGTIGSKTYGVAKEVSLVGVKVFTYKGGEADDPTVIAGLDAVMAHHAQNPGPAVVNLSLGGPKSEAIDVAMRKVVDAGIISVVAAGNDNADACADSPAGEPKMITVAAMAAGDRKASYSNWGKCIDVIAPGSSITSTDKSGGTSVKDGTSMASPHVAGVVALYLSTNLIATPTDVDVFLAANSLKNVVTGFSSDTPNLFAGTFWNVPAPTPGEPWAEKITGQVAAGQTALYPSSQGFSAIVGSIITAATEAASIWDGGNVNLYLKKKDASGNMVTVASSEKGDVDEKLTYTVTEAGTYFIEIKAIMDTKFILTSSLK